MVTLTVLKEAVLVSPNSEFSKRYLAGYPPHLVQQIQRLHATRQLAPVMLGKYPALHDVRTDRRLYEYVQEMKGHYLTNTGPLSKVAFDSKLQAASHALGTLTRIARVQGARLKAKHEIRVAAAFKTMPLAFLRMIVVHELAHTRHQEHDKAFYQLCRHMEPDYHQLEFDLRVCLAYSETTGQTLWEGAAINQLPGAAESPHQEAAHIRP